MLHLPMEPNGRNDPGPNALLVSLSDAELRQRTTAALDSFDGFAGVNNHMGSRFTAFKPGMETVLRQLKGRGLMFLDSRTSAQSVGDQLAQEMGVPSIVRHVFLDDEESLDAVRRSSPRPRRSRAARASSWRSAIRTRRRCRRSANGCPACRAKASRSRPPQPCCERETAGRAFLDRARPRAHHERAGSAQTRSARSGR